MKFDFTLPGNVLFGKGRIKELPTQAINLDIQLTNLGIKKSMINQLVDNIFKYTKCMLDVHPKIFSREEIKNILLLAL